MNWNLWFGKLEDNKLNVVDFHIAFQNAQNDSPLPFNLFEVGRSLFRDDRDYYKTLRKIAIKICEERVEKELKREDRYVVALVKALEEIEESKNLLSEKLDDIRGIVENELTKAFDDRIKYLDEMGKMIENEIERVMTKIAPNITELLGAKIAAKLLERAGSFEKLVKLPASKIQIMGAEKSLYKALSRIKKGQKAKVPKHGIIFVHPYIRQLPKSKRGKMARFLAAKIAIAAKIDYFRGELNESILEAVRKRYEELSR
ncbi:MAG: RNA-processing protein [Archaeoglobales archaeon]|nr:RNA-processing protein [Archaeoglobales archaeon]